MPDASHLALYAALLVAAGLGSGFAGGLFGVGGGILRVPIFLYLFPAFGVDPAVSMHMAAGTSLALAVPTAWRSAAGQRRAGHLEPAFARSWIPPLVLGVLVGLGLMRVLPGSALVGVFGVAMLGVALEMLLLPDGVRLTPSPPGQPLRGLLAGGIGCVSTLIGVAGGAFTTPALVLLGYPVHRAVAVSAAGSAAVAAIGAAGCVVNGLTAAGRPAFSLGYVDLLAVAAMLPAILVAVPLGVRLGSRLSERRLRRLFGVLLVGVALDMLRGALLRFA